jgi:phage-related minor tail protein
MAVLKFSMSTLGMEGGMLARVLGFGATAWRAFGAAAMFAGRMMLMNPIGLVVTAIAAAAFLIYEYWEPIRGFFSGLWDSIRSTFSAAASWFATLPATFSAFGSNIVSGLVNGITSGLGTVKDAIVNVVASSTVGWFKEKLGIHSPSRVFGELGGFISQGGALGMEGEQGRVAKAAIGRGSRRHLIRCASVCGRHAARQRV